MDTDEKITIMRTAKPIIPNFDILIQEIQMKKFIIAVIATLFAANVAFAADTTAAPATPSCADKAAEKKLAGAAKTSFIKKCEKDAAAATTAAAPATPSCADKAAEKKLAGAAKASFIKKCEKDVAAATAATAPATSSCADKAAEKKLAGAAKASFIKKCEKDAKTAK
jgi:hypothetical protein